MLPDLSPPSNDANCNRRSTDADRTMHVKIDEPNKILPGDGTLTLLVIAMTHKHFDAEGIGSGTESTARQESGAMAAHRGMVPLAVGIVGPGLIGRTLMKQISAQVYCAYCGFKRKILVQFLTDNSSAPCLQAKRLHNTLQVDRHVLGIISSRSMFLYNQKGCDLETWQTDLAMSVGVIKC